MLLCYSWCDIRKDFTDLTHIDVDDAQRINTIINYFVLGSKYS